MMATGAETSTYILGAAICATDVLDQTRADARLLLLKGQRKPHWRDESPKRRQQILDQIIAMPLEHVVVFRDSQTTERQERRRRLSMQGLLPMLDDRGIEHATFESRGKADDARDRHLLDSVRASHGISSQLRLYHTKGPLEPMLWIADAVCGMVSTNLGGNDLYLTQLQASVTVEIIELP